MANLSSDKLVDRDSGMDIRTGGFFNADTGKKRAAGPSIITPAGRTRGCIDMIHATQNLELILNISERLHGLSQLEILVFAFGPPTRLDRAVGEINKTHAQRCAGGSSSEPGRRVGFGSQDTR